MNQVFRLVCLTLLAALALVATACLSQPQDNSGSATTPAAPSPSPSPSATAGSLTSVSAVPVTLPIIDAFFATDQTFAGELATKLNLTPQQIEQLRTLSREETSKLNENASGNTGGESETARELAAKKLTEVLGEEKASKLGDFVRERWRGEDSASANAGEAKTTPPGEGENLPVKPNAVPTDTRIVVNTPAYRMDVFENGQLIKSYKVGIGYPEFPLPTGLRKARAIIFNPTWTPPDEPWVESPSSKVRVGEKVEAGSKLNPLGVLKIPIGSPSLIHGGKSPAKLGTFASHGCVGLTDALVQDFAKQLAKLGGAKLSDADIAGYKQNKTETKQVTLRTPVPVELRYETIVAENGKLHIYRDVYDRNTNTEENLRAVLEANGVTPEDLTETERSQTLEALNAMSTASSRKINREEAKSGSPPSPSPSQAASPSPVSGTKKTGKVTHLLKGQKEVVIEIAALKSKGYPVAVNLNSSTGKAKTQTAGTR